MQGVKTQPSPTRPTLLRLSHNRAGSSWTQPGPIPANCSSFSTSTSSPCSSSYSFKYLYWFQIFIIFTPHPSKSIKTPNSLSSSVPSKEPIHTTPIKTLNSSSNYLDMSSIPPISFFFFFLSPISLPLLPQSHI